MTKSAHRNRGGMTLVEILITVSIIGLLAAFIIPAYIVAAQHRENALVASHLRTALTAFALYRSETGAYPPNSSRGKIPPAMAGYFAELQITQWWTNATELGGKWDWDNDSGNKFKYRVTIADATKTGQMAALDKLVDDGNLATGKFRLQDSEYCYSLDE